MRLKMQSGGTAKQQNLCDSCKFQQRISFQNGREVIKCDILNVTLASEVGQCTEFKDKNFVSIREMKDKAWLIEVSKSRKIGFEAVAPNKRSQDQQDDVDQIWIREDFGDD